MAPKNSSKVNNRIGGTSKQSVQDSASASSNMDRTSANDRWNGTKAGAQKRARSQERSPCAPEKKRYAAERTNAESFARARAILAAQKAKAAATAADKQRKKPLPSLSIQPNKPTIQSLSMPNNKPPTPSPPASPSPSPMPLDAIQFDSRSCTPERMKMMQRAQAARHKSVQSLVPLHRSEKLWPSDPMPFARDHAVHSFLHRSRAFCVVDVAAGTSDELKECTAAFFDRLVRSGSTKRPTLDKLCTELFGYSSDRQRPLFIFHNRSLGSD